MRFFNLRFSGQYYDTESGLSYNINRMYDADAKRYMQSDPMGLMAGWNTYNYVGRNPLNNVDPLGLAYDKHIVKFFNCDALKLLIERERDFNGKIYDYYNENFIEEISSPSPYRVFSFSEDLIQLNASFDSIIGKVDLDYTLRIADSMKSSIIQSESMYNMHYHLLKYGWNGINIIKSGLVNDFTGLINLGNAIAGKQQIPYENYGTLNMGMEEEGHKNAYKAAYLYNKGLKLKDLFHPAIVNCNNFCGTKIKG